MSIYSRIERIVKEKGTNIARLEREVGIGNGCIRRWETSSPSVKSLAKVADCLGVSIAYLYNGHEPMDSTLYKLAKNAEGLSEEDIALLSQMIERLKQMEGTKR